MKKSASEAYVPFPNVPWRNNLQSHVELPLMIKALRIPLGRRILELGCGRGIGLGPLSQLLEPVRLVGVDFDRPLLAEAVVHLGAEGVPATCVAGDIRSLPFAAASFDVIVDFGTCYHAGNPEASLREVDRVLAPGGVFVYESPLSQALAHPIRTKGRRLPWREAPDLIRLRRAGLVQPRQTLPSPCNRLNYSAAALTPLHSAGHGPSGLGTRDSGLGTRDSGLGTRDSGLGTQNGNPFSPYSVRA